MNVFDVGGLIGFIALVASVIIGTAIFVGLHKILDIVHLGFRAMIGMWCVCCIVAAFIVNIFSAIIGWALSTIWVLVKIALVIGVVGSVVKFIYNKIAGNKE